MFALLLKGVSQTVAYIRIQYLGNMIMACELILCYACGVHLGYRVDFRLSVWAT
jgi:hypothetical protein